MARKRNRPQTPESGTKTSRGKTAAKIGLGAFLVGAVTWLTGGFTRENGLEWLKSIAIALALATLIRWPITEPFKIPSGSMRPTFMEGDRIFVNKWVYGVRFPLNRFQIWWTKFRIHYADRRIWHGAEPQRWDIVVFKAIEEDAVHDTLVKRVVGLPGERIHIDRDGRLLVNGEAVEVPDCVGDEHGTPGRYTRPMHSGGYGVLEDDEHSLVPEGHYFLLGDNSNSSRDARWWGWMPNEHILGRVSCIAWPLDRRRDLTGFTNTYWWRSLTAVLGLLLLWRLFLGRSCRIRHAAEKGELSRGDHVFINRVAFGMPVPFTGSRLSKGREPRRGELVLYEVPETGEDKGGMFIGRVAGLPGEQVSVASGKLEIDRDPVSEPASLAERAFAEDKGNGPFGVSKRKEHSNVPDGHYFLLADEDNQEDSPDSRSLGWIPRQSLVGVVSNIWWPPTRWRRV
jgi:signal peptidase I